MAKTMKKLTPKQEAFALAYCRLMNGSDAYRAVYAPKKATAKTINEAASRLLKNSKVAARVSEVIEKAAENTGLSVERTLKEISRVAYFDGRKLYNDKGDLIPANEWDADTAAAISHMSNAGPVPFDKNSALEKAMKYHGLYEKDNNQKGDTAIIALMAAVGENAAKFEVKQ